MARMVDGTVVRHGCLRLNDRVRVSVCSGQVRMCSPKNVVSKDLVRRLSPVGMPSGHHGPLLTSFFGQLRLVRHEKDNVGGVIGRCGRFRGFPKCGTPRFGSGSKRFRIAL